MFGTTISSSSCYVPLRYMVTARRTKHLLLGPFEELDPPAHYRHPYAPSQSSPKKDFFYVQAGRASPPLGVELSIFPPPFPACTSKSFVSDLFLNIGFSQTGKFVLKNDRRTYSEREQKRGEGRGARPYRQSGGGGTHA